MYNIDVELFDIMPSKLLYECYDHLINAIKYSVNYSCDCYVMYFYDGIDGLVVTVYDYILYLYYDGRNYELFAHIKNGEVLHDL